MSPSAPLALVTGGAGFIGSHLVAALLDAGTRVRVLDNLSTGRAENLAAVRDRVDFLAGDLTDPAAVARAMAGVDTIYHLAAQVSVMASLRDPAHTEAVNTAGTAALLSAAARAGVRRLVFSSSCAVYGDDPELPKTEESRVVPLSPYAASKREGELLAGRQNERGEGLTAVCLRYFNVYGPRQQPDSDYAAVVPRFLALARQGRAPTIYGDGEQTRDFVHVSDIVRANLRAARLVLAPGTPHLFNIGTGEATSVNQLWRLIAGLAGCAEPARHAAARAGEVRHSYGSSALAGAVLGFRPEVGLAQGLRSTLAALQTDPAR
jgi:UDP-glucose 4-epimerase